MILFSFITSSEESCSTGVELESSRSTEEGPGADVLLSLWTAGPVTSGSREPQLVGRWEPRDMLAPCSPYRPWPVAFFRRHPGGKCKEAEKADWLMCGCLYPGGVTGVALGLGSLLIWGGLWRFGGSVRLVGWSASKHLCLEGSPGSCPGSVAGDLHCLSQL